MRFLFTPFFETRALVDLELCQVTRGWMSDELWGSACYLLSLRLREYTPPYLVFHMGSGNAIRELTLATYKAQALSTEPSPHIK